LSVTYVAEYHESLQHVFVFLDVSGLRAGFNLEAEVVPQGNAKPGHLILRCDSATSQPLALPAHVSTGPATVSVVGGRHYQIKLPMANSAKLDSPSEASSSEYHELLDSTYFLTVKPTSFICSSCSLPLVRASRLNRYRDLPSEHWAELVDAWMCHADQKLHEHVQKGSKEGFWPVEGEALVGGSYVLVREDVIVRVNLNDVETQGKSTVSLMSIIVLVVRTHKKAGIGLSLPMAVYSLLGRSVIWS
jgi:ubiquitin-protein ligase E3 D